MNKNKGKNKIAARSFKSRVHYNPSHDFGESKKTQEKSNVTPVPSTQKKSRAWKPIPPVKTTVEPRAGDFRSLEVEKPQQVRVNSAEEATILKKGPVNDHSFQTQQRSETAELPAQHRDYEGICIDNFKQQSLAENFMKLPNVNAGDPLELILNCASDWPTLSYELQYLTKATDWITDLKHASQVFMKFHNSRKEAAKPASHIFMSTPENLPALPHQTQAAASMGQQPTASEMGQQSAAIKATLESQEALLRSILGLQPKSSSSSIQGLDFSHLKLSRETQQHEANFTKDDFPALPQSAASYKFEPAKPQQLQTDTLKIDRKTASNIKPSAEMGHMSNIHANMVHDQLINPPKMVHDQLINPPKMVHDQLINPPKMVHDQLINPPNMVHDQLINPPKMVHDQFINPPKMVHDQLINPPNMVHDQFINPPNMVHDQFINPPKMVHDQLINPPKMVHDQFINPPNMLHDQYGRSGLVAFAYKQLTETDLLNLQSGAEQKLVSEFLPSFPGAFGSAGGVNLLQPFSSLPKEYCLPSQVREKLNVPSLSNLGEELLFLLFYHFPGEEVRMMASQELFARNWRFYNGKRCWMTPCHPDATQRVGEYEYGLYFFFDPLSWKAFTNEARIKFSDLEIIPPVFPPLPHNTQAQAFSLPFM